MKNAGFLEDNGVNLKQSIEIFGDMETYDDSLVVFLEEVGDKLSKIKSYKETSDMRNYAILVHSLKSDAKYFGFDKLGDMAYQHEVASKANDSNYVFENYDALMNEAERIVNVVSQYLGETTPKLVKEETPVIKDKAILVVDDSDIVRNFIQKIFDNRYAVFVAEDGLEAIKIIESYPENVILGMLLDINMPNIDGFSVLDYFKKKDLFAKIPVCIITGNDEKGIDHKAFEYPIVDILKKPFNEKNIKDLVDKLLLAKENNPI